MKNNEVGVIMAFLIGIIITGAVAYIYYNRASPGSADAPVASLNSAGAGQGSKQTLSLENSVTEKSIPIVAVNQAEDTGVLGNLTIRLIPGNSDVLIDTTPFVETDLQYSANVAIEVAKEKAKDNATNEDFVVSYQAPSEVVGGGSAGADTTIAAIAALENRQINKGVIMTGTINPDGTIGQIGGVIEKAQAAADAGYKLFLIPKGQSVVTYYTTALQERKTRWGYTIYTTRYIPKTVNLKDALNTTTMQIKEVSNIDEAMNYFFN